MVTFISSIKEGKPPMDMKVMNPEIKPPEAPRAKIAVLLVPTSKKIVPTHIATSIYTIRRSQ